LHLEQSLLATSNSRSDLALPRAGAALAHRAVAGIARHLGSPQIPDSPAAFL